MKLSQSFNEFFNNEKSGGILLILCTLISLLISNSFLGEAYIQFWNSEVPGGTVLHWINEGLMAVFFLFIGLELEREIFNGELSNLKRASLPVFAAVGGMLVPAGIFLLFNFGTTTQSGAGIPMATDIAFAVGALSLLGKRVPLSLKIFLTALAVMDDLGAILIIAFCYSDHLVWMNLIFSLLTFTLLLFLNRQKVQNLTLYITGGILMWYFLSRSGIHATISGVLLAFAIPFGKESRRSPSAWLLHKLNKPVAFIVIPLFALANTCLLIPSEWNFSSISTNSLGIFLGLVVGKPLGIFLFSLLAVLSGFSVLPKDLNWKIILGAGMLGGIGFTMSIFITLLAYDPMSLIIESKLTILMASFFAGIFGYVWLVRVLKRVKVNEYRSYLS